MDEENAVNVNETEPSSLSRIAKTLMAMLHTRFDLFSVELEEELLRWSTYFIYSVIALFCGGVAISLTLVFVISYFWDDHRVAVLLSLIGFFSAATVGIMIWLRSRLLNKPHLFQQSITELKKDVELLHLHETKSDQADT